MPSLLRPSTSLRFPRPKKHPDPNPSTADELKTYSQDVINNFSIGTKHWTANKDKAFYRCSLCFNYLRPGSQPYVLPGSAEAGREPGSGRIFCYDCWIWLYNVSICWVCGEIVARDEDRVGFGWCWWHWSCLSCLICRTPLPPLLKNAEHEQTDLVYPPLCSSCPEDLAHSQPEARAFDGGATPAPPLSERVKQANRVFHTRKAWRQLDSASVQSTRSTLAMAHSNESVANLSLAKPNNIRTSTHVSIYHPLERAETFNPPPTRPLPDWMRKLPSHRPDRENSQRSSSPAITLPSKMYNLNTQTVNSSNSSQSTLGRSSPPTERLRASWSAEALPLKEGRPSLAAFLEELKEEQRRSSLDERRPFEPLTTSSISALRSKLSNSRINEVDEENFDSLAAQASSPSLVVTDYDSPTSTPDIVDNVCPICDESLTTDPLSDCDSSEHKANETVSTSDGTRYHLVCITCRYCRKPFKEKDTASGWVFLDRATPYHKWCGAKGARPILQRLKQRVMPKGGKIDKGRRQGFERLRELQNA